MSAPTADPRGFGVGTRYAGAVAAVVVCLATALVVAPVLGAPGTRVLGSLDSEGPAHVVALAVSLENLWRSGPWTLPQVPGMPNPIEANIAPLATVLGWPFHVLGGGGLRGAALAWNAQWLLTAIAGPLGAWLFVREWLGDTRAAAYAAATCACSAAFLETAGVGRLEELALYLWPLHVAFLYRACVSRGGARETALATVTFAAIALQGGLPAIALAAAELPLAVALLWTRRDRRTIAILACVAIGGVLAVTPFALAHLAHPPPPLTTGHRGETIVGIAQLLPGGASIPFRHGYHVRPYPGVAAVLLAGASAALDRRGRAWLAAALVTLVLCLGPSLQWTPDGAALATLPAHWIGMLVPRLPMTGWNRLAAFLPPLLAFAVAPIVARFPRAGLLGLIVCAEQIGAGWEPGSWSLAPPDGLAEQIARGGVVEAPADDRAILWGHLLPRGEPAWPMDTDVALLTWLQGLAPTPTTQLRVRDLPTADLDPGCVATGAAALGEQGFRVIALRLDGLPEGAEGRIDTTLGAALGEPVRTPGMATWTLSPRVAPGPCAPVEQARRAGRNGARVPGGGRRHGRERPGRGGE